ncbi:MAG: F0F1 ATP synthase subunit B [Clostridiales Family XIII bacterium]|jgi:F-type H+-transporting ATPase subunit b|nr:F0F1 ATP synthase subunit B [Clostridiales Family XIII bacterium]
MIPILGAELVAPLIGFDATFIFVLITFFILYLIFKKFFFEKVRDFMQAREQKVIDSFDNAAAVNVQAEERLLEYNKKLESAEFERRDLLKDAKTKADLRAQTIISEANDRAAEIVRQAEAEIERERQIAVEAMRDQVAMLAVLAAEKIIEKQLDEEGQMLIIDEIIKGSGQDSWTH